MADQTRERVGMSLAEWERRWQDGPFELINGEIVTAPIQIFGQAIVHREVFLALIEQEKIGTGEVFIHMGYVKMEGANWITASYLPSIVFLQKARIDNYRATTPNYKSLPLIIVPDIVVQITHPMDTYDAIEEKIDHYLADGVQVVWVISPTREAVSVRLRGTHRFLGKTDTLTDPLLPGFSLPLNEIFSL
jgi:Uma2 family endonuclease